MVCLSGLFSYEAVPLVNAIKNISMVHFEWADFKNLYDDFRQGKVDGILCPPLMTLDYPGSLIVPGVGISTLGGVPSPVLFSKKLIEDVKAILIDERYKHWENWIRIVWKLLNPNVEISLRVGSGMGDGEDAFLASAFGDETLVEGLYIYNLGELWKRVSSYPMVCWVWLCRREGNYREIRNILGQVWEEAKENLREFQRGKYVCEDITKKEEVHLEDLEGIYYHLASLEFEGIYWLVEQGKKMGLISESAEIHLC